MNPTLEGDAMNGMFSVLSEFLRFDRIMDQATRNDLTLGPAERRRPIHSSVGIVHLDVGDLLEVPANILEIWKYSLKRGEHPETPYYVSMASPKDGIYVWPVERDSGFVLFMPDIERPIKNGFTVIVKVIWRTDNCACCAYFYSASPVAQVVFPNGKVRRTLRFVKKAEAFRVK